jgi:hypothetical protein
LIPAAGRYSLPVCIANDGHRRAGQYMFGGRQNAANLVAIKVGQGIGAGIVLQGCSSATSTAQARRPRYRRGERSALQMRQRRLPGVVASIPAMSTAPAAGWHDPGSLLLRHHQLEDHARHGSAGVPGRDPAAAGSSAIGRYLGVVAPDRRARHPAC